MEQAKYFADRLGCPTDTAQNISNCLRNMDATVIGRAHMEAAVNFINLII